MKDLRYIGKKPQKDDNVAGTGTVWHGAGDVQAVPDNAAAKLLAHTGIWELAADTPATTTDSERPEGDTAETKKVDELDDDARPPMANLEAMDKTALKDFAQRHFGHEFHHNAGEAKMRQTIVGLMNRG